MKPIRRYFHEELRVNHMMAKMDEKLVMLDRRYPFDGIQTEKNPDSFDIKYHLIFKEGEPIDVYLRFKGKHIVIDASGTKKVHLPLSFHGLKQAQRTLGRIKKTEKENNLGK